MFGKLGIWELVLILVIVLVIFGPKKLPEIGKSLGRGLREFKHATKGMFGNGPQAAQPRESAGPIEGDAPGIADQEKSKATSN